MPPSTLTASTPPFQVRQAIRRGDWTKHTSGLAPGFAQANLVILPAQYADDFMRFCLMNPRPCPLLDVTRPGDPSPLALGEKIDLRHDLPRYRLYHHGELETECTDIADYWQDDFVSFSIGCSFSFEEALLNDGIDVRHISHGRNVPMYRTNRTLAPSGPFRGELVVSMRPLPAEQAIRAIQITTDMPRVHGAPVHIGNPALLGIQDLASPDFGEPPVLHDDDLPVFWACGVTPQLAIERAKLPFVITQSPGYMLITDLPNQRLRFS